MKTLSLMLFAALLAGAGASQAGERGNCPERGRCRIAPLPPVPPVAPVPPTPPAEAIAPMAPIAPPPPPVPAMPNVPSAAHDACLGKAIGAKLTYHPRKGDTMRGTCQKDSQGMYFEVQEYRSVN